MTLEGLIGYFANIDTREILVEDMQGCEGEDPSCDCLAETFQSVEFNQED